MRRLRPRDVALLVLSLAVAAGCIRLGFWQRSRLDQRRERNALIVARLALPPVDQPTTLEDEALLYRHVRLLGTFDPEHEVLIQNRTLEDVAGYHLVSPLRLVDGGAVLVDRGWIPFEQGTRGDLDAYRLDEPVEIVGIVLPPQQEPPWTFLADAIPEAGQAPLERWRVLNVAGIQAQTPYALYPYYVAQAEPLGKPESPPIPQPEIDLSEGPHLSYAIQWFAFATIALVGGVALTRRAARHAPPREDLPHD